MRDATMRTPAPRPGRWPRALLLGALLAALASPAAGCRRGEAAAPPACPPAAVKPFGSACAADCECATGVCAEFGDGTKACSHRCTDASECPPGSRGQKCTKQGFCRT